MDRDALYQAIDILGDNDSDVKAAMVQVGYPEPRIRPQGFETFLSTIISQQISTEAARTILSRVHALLAEKNAKALLAVPVEKLREAGMSQRKVEYALGLASAIVEGRFNVEALAEMDDESAIQAIIALRGFGRWSAEIYLMFSLGRQNIFPADDLALQVALGKLKGLTEKPTPKQARTIVDHWQPHRSAGAIFLWHYYRGAPQ